jgi:peptide/nickel transport system substrate-binding protein
VLDPTLSQTFSADVVFDTFCEKLYDIDDKAHIVPELAAALPTVSKDRLTATIPLRRGIRFNDGTPFNASAVVTTLRRHQTMEGSFRASDLAPIERVGARGALMVVVRLKAPYPLLATQLANKPGLIMSPTQLAKLGNRFGTNPVCVGPFMYRDRVAGDSITVVESPYYYRKKDVHLSKIVFKVENNFDAATLRLRAGDLQALDRLAPTAVSTVAGDPKLYVIKRTSLGYDAITINIGNKNGIGERYSNVGTPIAAHPKLRKAFEMAIDRKLLNRVVWSGTDVPDCSPISPASTWHDPKITCTPYDPKQAKKLVAQSGVSNPTVHLMVIAPVRLGEFLQAQQAAVGIRLVVETVDLVSSLSRTTTGQFDTSARAWLGGIDPDLNMYKQLTTRGTNNASGYSNPQLDRILEGARTAGTTNARKKLYREAVRLVLDDRPLIYLDHPVTYAGISTQLQGVRMLPDTVLRVAFASYK